MNCNSAPVFTELRLCKLFLGSACEGYVYVSLVSLLPTITNAVALNIIAWEWNKQNWKGANYSNNIKNRYVCIDFRKPKIRHTMLIERCNI